MDDATTLETVQAEEDGKGEKSPYHHGNLKASLIERGLSLLEEYGADGLSLRLLARQLGVSQTAPYHHFGDKNALLAALAAEGFRRAGAVLRTVSIKQHSLERRIRGLSAGYVRFARQSPELFRLMYGNRVQRKEDYPDFVMASSDAFDALSARVEEMITDFGIRHVGKPEATVMLLALNHGLAHLIIDKRLSPVLAEVLDADRVLIEQAARLFVTGFHPDSDRDAMQQATVEVQP